MMLIWTTRISITLHTFIFKLDIVKKVKKTTAIRWVIKTPMLIQHVIKIDNYCNPISLYKMINANSVRYRTLKSRCDTMNINNLWALSCQ